MDPVVRNINKNEKFKLDAWIQDQYYHPVESSHTYDEILNWFEEKNIEFINAYPSFIMDPRNDSFFKKIKNNSKFDRLIQQICMIFNRQGSEGGLFLFLGKKIW